MLYVGKTIVSVKMDAVIEMTTVSVSKTGTVGTLFFRFTHTHTHAHTTLYRPY